MARGTRKKFESPIIKTGREASRKTLQIGGPPSSLSVSNALVLSGKVSPLRILGSRPAYTRSKTGSMAPRIISAAAAMAPTTEESASRSQSAEIGTYTSIAR